MTGISSRAVALKSAAGRRRGMTLIEAMIAMAIVAFALVALMSLITTSGTVQHDSRNRTFAYNRARQVLEEMRGDLYLSQIFDKYKKGGTVGNEFWINEIPPGQGSLKGTVPAGEANFKAQGTIIFPQVAGQDLLTETPTDALLARDFGMPKDLNRNGTTTDTNLMTGDISILPVKIVVEWGLPGGKFAKIEVVTLITER